MSSENFEVLTWLDRVKLEQSELQKKLDDLTVLLAKGQPESIPEQQWTLMERQQFHMALYNSLLLDRIEVA